MAWVPHSKTRVRYPMPMWPVEELLADIQQAGMVVAVYGLGGVGCRISTHPPVAPTPPGYAELLTGWNGWDSWHGIARLWLWTRRHQAMRELCPVRDLAGPMNPWRAT